MLPKRTQISIDHQKNWAHEKTFENHLKSCKIISRAL
jgi:hypothetical protein